MVIYAPGTEETDPKKQNISLQQNAAANSTNATNIATNTTNIATNTSNITALQTKTSGYESAWSQSTATPVANAGSFTTASATIRQKVNGKTVFIWCQATITTLGTGTAGFFVPIPTSSLNTSPMGAIDNNTGVNFTAYTSAGNLFFSPSSNQAHVYYAAGSYEAA